MKKIFIIVSFFLCSAVAFSQTDNNTADVLVMSGKFQEAIAVYTKEIKT